jgi:hypothetical protein
MGIPKRIMVTISGLAFTGATALMIGAATPASAATSATPAGTVSVVAPVQWDDWGWDDGWGWDDDFFWDDWDDCW